MLAPVALVLALIAGSLPKNCPLFEREYKVPPVNGPKEISKDPAPKEKP